MLEAGKLSFELLLVGRIRKVDCPQFACLLVLRPFGEEVSGLSGSVIVRGTNLPELLPRLRLLLRDFGTGVVALVEASSFSLAATFLTDLPRLEVLAVITGSSAATG